MNVLVSKHAITRFRDRLKCGRNFNHKGASDWIERRVRALVKRAPLLRVIDQNNEDRLILDLDKEICAVLKAVPGGIAPPAVIVLTILTNHMKDLSINEGWWQPFDGVKKPGPKTEIVWRDGTGKEHRNLMPGAMVPMKVGRLIRGGVDPTSISVYPPKEGMCNRAMK